MTAEPCGGGSGGALEVLAVPEPTKVSITNPVGLPLFFTIVSVCPEMRNFAQGRGGWKKITTAIWLIFRGLFFPPNEETGQKNHLWIMGEH
jgi:hypothetical protein